MGERSDLEFPAGEGSCAAWVYRPGAARSRPGPCVVMGHGFSLTRHDGLACPLWVGLGEQDISVSGKAVERLAARAPKGELHRHPYDHWQPHVGDAPPGIAADQIDFLRRIGLLGP